MKCVSRDVRAAIDWTKPGAYHALEAGVQIGHPQLEDQRQVVAQLSIEQLEDLARLLLLLLSPGHLDRVLLPLLGKLAQLRARGVIVEQLRSEERARSARAQAR